MSCTGYLVMFVVLVVHSQIDPSTPTIDIRFKDKRLECSMVKSVDVLYPIANDCTTFLYVNDKMIEHVKGKQLSYKYKKLLQVTAKCYGACENSNYKNKAMESVEIVINTEIFIGLCCAGGAMFIIIVALFIFWWCKWGRRFDCNKCAFYKEIESDEQQMTDIEKEKPKDMKEKPKDMKVKPKDVKEKLKDMKEKPKDVSDSPGLEKQKKLSESSEEDNLRIDSVNPYLQNVNYNYNEMTSDI